MMIRSLLTSFMIMLLSTGWAAAEENDFLFHLQIASGKLVPIYGSDRFPARQSVTMYVGDYGGSYQSFAIHDRIDTKRLGVQFSGVVKFDPRHIRGRTLLIYEEHAQAVPGTYNFFMIKSEDGKGVCLFNPYRPITLVGYHGSISWRDVRACW